MPRYFENSTFVAAILENRHFDLVGLISRCPNFDFRIQDTFYHRNQLKNLIKYVCPDNAIFSPPLLAYMATLLRSIRAYGLCGNVTPRGVCTPAFVNDGRGCYCHILVVSRSQLLLFVMVNTLRMNPSCDL